MSSETGLRCAFGRRGAAVLLGLSVLTAVGAGWAASPLPAVGPRTSHLSAAEPRSTQGVLVPQRPHGAALPPASSAARASRFAVRSAVVSIGGPTNLSIAPRGGARAGATPLNGTALVRRLPR